jgi:hypothetical protein
MFFCDKNSIPAKSKYFLRRSSGRIEKASLVLAEQFQNDVDIQQIIQLHLFII